MIKKMLSGVLVLGVMLTCFAGCASNENENPPAPAPAPNQQGPPQQTPAPKKEPQHPQPPGGGVPKPAIG